MNLQPETALKRSRYYMLYRCLTLPSLPQRKLRFMCWEYPDSPMSLLGLGFVLFFLPLLQARA